VHALGTEILNSGTTWVGRAGAEYPLTLKDIVIVAPYNAQVFELHGRLPGARVGTGDKFQGQEAPIVIYSITTSSQADAPRGMKFSPSRALSLCRRHAPCRAAAKRRGLARSCAAIPRWLSSASDAF
jgi:AAA domain